MERKVRTALGAKKTELPQHWRRLINLGYAANLAGSEIEEQVKRIRSDIGFQYARICRITDLISEYEIAGQYLRDYSAIFMLLDPLRDNQMVPFLELGNKSFLIQESTAISIAPVSPSDSRAYYERLIDILPDFLAACINHYGQEYFDQWYFEISYMYTDDTARETFGFAQYAGMFRRIYRILRDYSARCHIGGPGFNDWAEPSRLTQALQGLKSPKHRPDFISAYLYPIVINEKGQAALSPDSSMIEERLSMLAETVREFDPSLEIWITEFNSNLSARNFLNDSAYQAAFLSGILLKSIPKNISALGYYLLSDAPLHYYDALDFLFGGWGLLSDRGLPKPSYQAFRLFSMLGHYLVRQSDRCLITANSNESYQLLFYRYAHPRKDFCVKNVGRREILDCDVVFQEAENETYLVTLKDLPTGTYLLKEYRVDESHANLLSAWASMDFLNPREERTSMELAALAAPVPRLQAISVASNEELQLTLCLDQIGVCLVTIDLYETEAKGGTR